MDSIKEKTITAYIAVTLPARSSLQRAKELTDVVRQHREVIDANFMINANVVIETRISEVSGEVHEGSI